MRILAIPCGICIQRRHKKKKVPFGHADIYVEMHLMSVVALCPWRAKFQPEFVAAKGPDRRGNGKMAQKRVRTHPYSIDRQD